MKDLQKIKEFFSKPLKEAAFKKGDKITYLGHPGVIKAVNKGQGKTTASNISNKGGEIKMMNESNGFTSGKQMINRELKRYPEAVAKVNQLIDMIGEDRFTMKMAKWIIEFFNNASFERPVNEAAKEEETRFHKKLDTLVHNTFGKRKGEMEEVVNYIPEGKDKIYSLISQALQQGKLTKDAQAVFMEWMADPNSTEEVIIKALESITGGGNVKEGMGNEIGDRVYFKGDMGEEYPPLQGYYGIIEDTTPAPNYYMMATYKVVVYDKNGKKIRTITTDFTNLTTTTSTEPPSKVVNEGKDSLKIEKQKDGKYYWTFKTEKSFDGFNTSAEAQKDFMYRSKFFNRKDENQFRREQDLKETLVKRVMEKLSKL